MDRVRTLLLVAVALNAVTVGATLDQALKQLPARHRIGVVAFSDYSRAADLANGVVWYASLGVSTSVLTLTVAAVVLRTRRGRVRGLVLLAGAGTVGHMLVTAWAAPLNFAQRAIAGDAAALTVLFDRFAALNTVRAVLQVAVLIAIDMRASGDACRTRPTVGCRHPRRRTRRWLRWPSRSPRPLSFLP